MLKVSNLSKHYKSTNFHQKSITFSLKEEEILGIVGENGVGKSTLLKIIGGLVESDSGEIYFKDKLLELYDNKYIRRKIVYIFQDSNLLLNKSVYYHLSLVYLLYYEKVNENEIDDILDLMCLKHLKHVNCCNLSGGQKQKVAIAIALLQNPSLILCDEISSGLDTNSELEIFNLLQEICRKRKIALLVVSHNLSLIKKICDRVLYISEGVIKSEIIPIKGKNYDNIDDYYNYVDGYLRK